MPVYPFKCTSCQSRTEIYRSVSEYQKDLPECCGETMSRVICAPMYMEEIKPFRSPVDGSYIDSRKKLADHNKKHNVVQIGDEKIKPKKREKDKTLREDLRRTYHDYKMRQT